LLTPEVIQKKYHNHLPSLDYEIRVQYYVRPRAAATRQAATEPPCSDVDTAASASTDDSAASAGDGGSDDDVVPHPAVSQRQDSTKDGTDALAAKLDAFRQQVDQQVRTLAT